MKKAKAVLLMIGLIVLIIFMLIYDDSNAKEDNILEVKAKVLETDDSSGCFQDRISITNSRNY